ncbi:MAG: hypothetical protein Q8L52_00865 [bacterium]|nr:hypothetical protein [bacterium]
MRTMRERLKVKAPGKPRVPKGPDTKAKPIFFTFEDVAAFFKREPARLVDYVETAMERGAAIPGIHVNQLLDLVGLPLKFGNQTLVGIPEDALVRLTKLRTYGNLGLILSLAREIHPSQQ